MNAKNIFTDARRWVPWMVAAVVLASPAARAAAPFAMDDAATTEPGHFEINFAFQHNRIEGERSGTAPAVDANYGAGPRLQLHAIAALAYSRAAGGNTRFGAGDTELGAKYRFLDADEAGWRPAMAVFPLIEVPTGDADRGLGTGHVRAFLPVWLSREIGDWTLFGGGGYWINTGAGFQNSWTVGGGALRKITDALTLGAEVFHATAIERGDKDTTGFNIGGMYDLTDNHHLLLAVGRGIQNPRTTNQLSVYAAYQLTF